MDTTENGVENTTCDLSQSDQLSLNSTPITMQQVKHRPTFSEDQVASLEAVFEKKQYLSSAERTQLANSISLTAQQVRVWFQNRRQKAKAYMSLRHADKSTGGVDNSEHLLVTPSPTTVSSIDPKLLLVQSPKETDTNGSEEPVTLVPATSMENPETSAKDDQTPSNNGVAIPIAEPIVSATASPAVSINNSQTSQAQPVFYLAPLIMPLLANSQGSSSSTPSLTTTSTASLAALAQLGQLTTSPANSPQLIPIQNLLADAQSKVKLEQLISPEALKLLDQSADGFKCTWKLDVKPSPVVSPSMSPGQVPPTDLLAQTPGEDKKGKRKRQVFSGFQTDELEGAFQVSAYVSAVERERLAQRVGLSPDQVKVWFQNRRTKKYRSSWRKSKQGSGQLSMEASPLDMEASPLAMEPGQLSMEPSQLSMEPNQLAMKPETGEPS